MSEEKKESEIKSEDKSASEKVTAQENADVKVKAAEEAKAVVEEKTIETTEAAEEAAEKTKAAEKAAESTKAADEAKIAAEAAAKAMAAAKAAEEAEAAAKEAIAKAQAAKEAAEKAAEEEYKAITAEVKADTAKPVEYTFKRQGEEIFRRDMGEPEFFLDKKDRFPRPILSQEQQESLTRKAEIPQDQTPKYNPEHVLSPEFGGLSNYERGVDSFLAEAKATLAKLKSDPESSLKQIRDAENDIKYLESIHENYFIGMNVFRTAKGGRSKLKA
ncbi:MAG: hypothetical protein K5790_07470 [Nitrosopumilus sp.]|uniref:hypothetical protein n=1 Tax=Nitrosopumilus sp. TaxID=2024843 RepID=UPI00247E2A84|nr:hypothetical protein [Nitrosopumilus sp.]MCV0393109.1 hypothetical protein [Nitrosopumilus sp.]